MVVSECSVLFPCSRLYSSTCKFLVTTKDAVDSIHLGFGSFEVTLTIRKVRFMCKLRQSRNSVMYLLSRICLLR